MLSQAFTVMSAAWWPACRAANRPVLLRRAAEVPLRDCLRTGCRLLQICPDGFHQPLDYTLTRWKQVGGASTGMRLQAGQDRQGRGHNPAPGHPFRPEAGGRAVWRRGPQSVSSCASVCPPFLQDRSYGAHSYVPPGGKR